jgi:DNA-binding NtrC family response regulator
LSEHRSELERVLREHGYTVVVPAAADQAVALSLHNKFHAALIDEVTLTQAEDWSLAQSLKMVRPQVPVLLLVKASDTKQQPMLEGVDCVVSEAADPLEVIDALTQCSPSEKKTASAS